MVIWFWLILWVINGVSRGVSSWWKVVTIVYSNLDSTHDLFAEVVIKVVENNLQTRFHRML